MNNRNTGGVRRHFNYSNVMSTLAVFLVIAGGTAMAAKIKTDSVKSKSIKNGQVKLADLGSNSVDSSKVVDNSLGGADINESQLTLPSSATPSGAAGGGLAGTYPNPTIAANAVGTAQIADNAVNSAKVANNTLTADDLGPNSVDTSELATDSVQAIDIAPASVSADEFETVTLRSSAAVPIAGGGGTATANVSCNAGEQLLSGGGQPVVFGVEMTSSRPNGAATGWTYQAVNNTGGASSLTAFALCLAP